MAGRLSISFLALIVGILGLFINVWSVSLFSLNFHNTFRIQLTKVLSSISSLYITVLVDKLKVFEFCLMR